MLNRRSLRRLSWLLMASVATVAIVFGATTDDGPKTNEERSADLAATIACPKCSGQPVSDSNAPVAEIIRVEIKRMVDEGRTDGEIRAVFVADYGEWVDLNPARTGLTGVVWIAPFLVAGVAAGALALAFSRWKGIQGSQEASADDRALVSQALEDRSASDDEADRV